MHCGHQGSTSRRAYDANSSYGSAPHEGSAPSHPRCAQCPRPDLLFQRAEEQGQQLPSREDLLRNQLVTGRFNVLSQNHRATFASADHPILAVKETEFLAPLGLSIVVIENPTREFIIGSHGTTIVETAQGKTAWLPVAPDVAISLSDRPGTINIGICTDEFVELHNTAALALSAQVTGHSKEVIQELLGARTDSAASVRSIDR